MKELKYTSQFKKDLKKIKNFPDLIAELKKALNILKKTGSLPKEYLPHKLKGIYKGCIEAHIQIVASPAF